MLLHTLLWLTMLPNQGIKPARAPKPRKPLYDSTKVSLANSPGITHKTAMQAAVTYGKIGAHKPLDRQDSAFLRIWSPAIIGAPDNATPPQLPTQPATVRRK